MQAEQQPANDFSDLDDFLEQVKVRQQRKAVTTNAPTPRAVDESVWEPRAAVVIYNRFVCECGHEVSTMNGRFIRFACTLDPTAARISRVAEWPAGLPLEGRYNLIQTSECPECLILPEGVAFSQICI